MIATNYYETERELIVELLALAEKTYKRSEQLKDQCEVLMDEANSMSAAVERLATRLGIDTTTLDALF